MHYAKILTTIKKTRQSDKVMAECDTLERQLVTKSFIEYIQNSENEKSSLLDMWECYYIERINTASFKLKQIKQSLRSSRAKDNIDKLLSAHNKILKFNFQKHLSNYYKISKKHAIYFVPFCQSVDPFKSVITKGLCIGHTYRYASLVEKSQLDKLTIVSNKTLLKKANENISFENVFFDSIATFNQIREIKDFKNYLWQVLSELDPQSIFNFTYKIKGHKIGHSIAIRIVDKGIELFDSNFGIVGFKTQQNFVTCMTELMAMQMKHSFHLSKISVYKLNFINHPDYNCYKTIGKVNFKSHSSQEACVLSVNIENNLMKLMSYGKKLLCDKKSHTYQQKGAELIACVERMIAMDLNSLYQYVSQLLKQPWHTLLRNSGSGMYFILSGFRSYSTTEFLLKELHEALRQECENVNKVDLC